MFYISCGKLWTNQHLCRYGVGFATADANMPIIMLLGQDNFCLGKTIFVGGARNRQECLYDIAELECKLKG